MIKGIGIDMVDIGEMKRYMETFGDVFVGRTFTKAEVTCAKESPRPHEYLAAHFAAKEAVFKAVAHHTVGKKFDFRIVETLNEPDGAPIIVVNDKLQALLDEAGIHRLHISITTEKDYAAAFVIAESLS